MLSRVADSIYWMSRQVERAENLARFLEITHNLVLDPEEDDSNPWLPLIQVTGDHEIFEDRYAHANAESVTQFLAFDRDYGNSMWSSLSAARHNAKGVREVLSSEAFECLNEFFHFVSDASTTEDFPVTESVFRCSPANGHSLDGHLGMYDAERSRLAFREYRPIDRASG